MLWLIAFGLAVIAGVAWWKPKLFRHYYETYVAATWIAVFPVVFGLLEFLQADQTWREIVPDQHEGWAALVIGGLLAWLRHMNVGK